jgi:hypothetical protein
MVRRKVFNKLHEELSLMRGENQNRYALWTEIAGSGIDPETMTKEQAIEWSFLYLEATIEQIKLAKVLKRFDPTAITPEEIMARICG